MNMNLTKLDFPDFEQEKLKNLNHLFSAWYTKAKNQSFENEKSCDDIVFDGFYPYYSAQACKILFIGRESLDMTGNHYLDCLHSCYEKGKVGNRTLNQSQFHALMLKIAYGLNNNNCPWLKIPAAKQIGETFATETGISFAFMNLSKFSNDSGHYKSDWPLIDNFISSFTNQAENFFNTEIEIIDPDIIVTMNLEQRLEALGERTSLEYTPNAVYYKIKCGKKSILLMDLYHFSAAKNHEDTFYTPILRGLEKYA